MLALKSAEALDSERADLKTQILGQKESLDQRKRAPKVITNYLAAGTRQTIEKRLLLSQRELESALIRELESEFPRWTKSIAKLMDSYIEWLSTNLHQRLGALSASLQATSSEPVVTAQQQLMRSVQDFRDRLSERTKRAFGVPLRTTEVDMRTEQPKIQDISIGRVFDHNWELISPLVPMWLVKPLVRRHLLNRTPYEIEKNLSRLASQWEETINKVLFRMEKDAELRLDGFVQTVEGLLATAAAQAPYLKRDLAKLQEIRAQLE